LYHISLSSRKPQRSLRGKFRASVVTQEVFYE
jgi:hypothetical protein